jgi:hypothetical protein
VIGPRSSPSSPEIQFNFFFKNWKLRRNRQQTWQRSSTQPVLFSTKKVARLFVDRNDHRECNWQSGQKWREITHRAGFSCHIGHSGVSLRGAVHFPNIGYLETLPEVLPQCRSQALSECHPQVMLLLQVTRWLGQEEATYLANVLNNLKKIAEIKRKTSIFGNQNSGQGMHFF